MSTWYQIEDKEDVTLSDDKKTVEIKFNADFSGSIYVEVPVSLIENALDSTSEDTSFKEFWDEYHNVTGLKKTDMQAAQKYWKKMTKKERKSALENITPWFKSLKEPKGSRYIKKGRTYLGDKNYLDEFEKPMKWESNTDRVYRNDGKPIKISIDTITVNNYAEYEQYCKEHKYNPETGESLI